MENMTSPQSYGAGNGSRTHDIQLGNGDVTPPLIRTKIVTPRAKQFAEAIHRHLSLMESDDDFSLRQAADVSGVRHLADQLLYELGVMA